MQRPIAFWLSVAAVVASWVFLLNYDIRGLDGIRIKPRGTPYTASSRSVEPHVAARGDSKIRVASFNANVLGVAKLNKAHVVDYLARIIRQYDIVALQEIRATRSDVVPQLVEWINAAERHYDYVIGEPVGRTVMKEQYAFIFDTETIEVDRLKLYTIQDPDDLIHRPPLVGWFRTRRPDMSKAFTFTLVNLHLDPEEAQQEVALLDDIFRRVRDDGRGEDDVILLGDFNADDRNLGPLMELPGMKAVVIGQPTNTRHTQQYDNLIFHVPTTSEYTGLGGVFDFLRAFNLKTEEALEISDHLPVWAEFSVYEGGLPGTVADSTPPAPARPVAGAILGQ